MHPQNTVEFRVHKAPFMRSSSVAGSSALYSFGKQRLRMPSYDWVLRE